MPGNHDDHDYHDYDDDDGLVKMRITRLENVCMLSVWDEMVLDDNVSYQLLFNGFKWFSKRF